MASNRLNAFVVLFVFHHSIIHSSEGSVSEGKSARSFKTEPVEKIENFHDQSERQSAKQKSLESA